MSEDQSKAGISQAPVNILFNPANITKKDVWEINIIQILELLIQILNQSGKKDLRVAGMAALSSSLIYRMKVESIFALQKAAMEKKPLTQRVDLDIDLINMPYRHESTYPVTLDELLNLLENIIGKYEELITNKISSVGSGLLKDIIIGLDTIDSIRCFLAILFLARDQKVELEQVEDDIKITLIKEKFTT